MAATLQVYFCPYPVLFFLLLGLILLLLLGLGLLLLLGLLLWGLILLGLLLLFLRLLFWLALILLLLYHRCVFSVFVLLLYIDFLTARARTECQDKREGQEGAKPSSHGSSPSLQDGYAFRFLPSPRIF